MTEEQKPSITQRMSLHLNGGSKFSQLNYDIFVNDKPTGIARITRTDGSPKYKKTSDTLYFKDEEYDILGLGAKGAWNWILDRARPATEGAV